MIFENGKEFGISLCGMLAMDTMRMESGYLHWGHDISPEENQYQAGLKFAVRYKKNKKFVMLTLNNSKPGEPLLLHDEPIYHNEKIIGRTTSGNYSFNYNKNMAFGYINSKLSKEELEKQKFVIEVEKQKYPASIILKPLNSKNIKTT